jgi:uroporphyrinogen-III synthase
VPSEHAGAALARGLIELEAGSIASRRILVPCAVDRNEDAARALRGAGAAVDELPVYRTVEEEPGHEELAALVGGIHAVLFLSGSAARAFRAASDRVPALAEALSSALVGCIGPSTAESARKAGIRVDVVPRERTARALVDAIEERFR